jgi:hypothetical protein
VSMHTSNALREARRALGELGARGQTTRVPRRARRAVLAYVAVARDTGLGWSQIVEEVGVSVSALRRWRDEEGVGDHVSLLPVEVVGDVDAVPGTELSRRHGVLTLVSPGGYRVEGLGVAQLAALLARVGE